jgi:nitroreductase
LIEDQGADMQFIELARKRYSVRSYKAGPVEDDKLQSVLQAARLAPTAANREAFRLIVLLTKNRESELLRIYNRSWFVQAPVVICICAIPNEAWVRSDGKNYSDVDAAIVMDHLVLAATDLGLGTCWIAAFDPVAAREVLGIPEQVDPIAFTPLGYPAGQSPAKKRKNLDDLVKHDHW